MPILVALLRLGSHLLHGTCKNIKANFSGDGQSEASTAQHEHIAIISQTENGTEHWYGLNDMGAYAHACREARRGPCRPQTLGETHHRRTHT